MVFRLRKIAASSNPITMKPQLLMLLLLAIPPLVANILACENAEKADAPVAAKSDALTQEIPATATPRTTPTSAAPTAPAPKRAPAPGTGTTSGLKAWFIM